jgi:hypothetical protein
LAAGAPRRGWDEHGRTQARGLSNPVKPRKRSNRPPERGREGGATSSYTPCRCLSSARWRAKPSSAAGGGGPASAQEAAGPPRLAHAPARATPPARPPRPRRELRRAAAPWGGGRRDETCPLSTGERTRRVQLVQGKGGTGVAEGCGVGRDGRQPLRVDFLERVHAHPCAPPRPPARQLRPKKARARARAPRRPGGLSCAQRRPRSA